MSYRKILILFLSLSWLVKGQIIADAKLDRRRLTKVAKTSNNKGADDFGKIVDRADALNAYMQGMKWSRVIQDTSFSYTSECTFDLNLECYLADDRNVSCNDYMSKLSSDLSLSCNKEIIVEYSITNVGKTDETVQNVKTSFNNERPFVDDLSLQSRYILPAQTLISSQTHSFDFCAAYQESQESSLLFEIEVDCVNGETHLSSFQYAFESIPPSDCSADLEISCQTLDGRPCQLDREHGGLCTFRPFYFDFLLSGGVCSDSENEQGSDKFSCLDYDDISTYSQVYVVVYGLKKKHQYFSGMVSKNQVFTVGLGFKVESDMRVKIYSEPGGIMLQNFRFHSSCSKNLSLGDSYGAITIAGFRDDLHDITNHELTSIASNTYNLSYVITNRGQNEILIDEFRFSSNEDDTFAVVASHGTTIKPTKIITGLVPVFNVTLTDFETTATLRYRTLPVFASKNCVAVDHYEVSTCTSKQPKGKGSKSQKYTNCKGKGANSSSSKKYKTPSSKSTKNSSKGSPSSKRSKSVSSSSKGSKYPTDKSASSKSKSSLSNKHSSKQNSSSKGSTYPKSLSSKSKSWKSPSYSKKHSPTEITSNSSKGSKGANSISDKHPSSSKGASVKQSGSSSSKGFNISQSMSSKSKSGKLPRFSNKDSSKQSGKISAKGSHTVKQSSSKGDSSMKGSYKHSGDISSSSKKGSIHFSSSKGSHSAKSSSSSKGKSGTASVSKQNSSKQSNSGKNSHAAKSEPSKGKTSIKRSYKHFGNGSNSNKKGSDYSKSSSSKVSSSKKDASIQSSSSKGSHSSKSFASRSKSGKLPSSSKHDSSTQSGSAKGSTYPYAKSPSNSNSSKKASTKQSDSSSGKEASIHTKSFSSKSKSSKQSGSSTSSKGSKHVKSASKKKSSPRRGKGKGKAKNRTRNMKN